MYGGERLCKFNKQILANLISDLGIKKVAPVKVKDPEIKLCAKQFAKSYIRAKRLHFRAKAIKEITEDDKDFKYFITAVKLCKAHSVTYKKFLKAQIIGLKFLNNGKGAFPKPSHLATDQAETRLLEYKEQGVTGSDDEIVQVLISVEEKKIPLTRNTRYQGRLCKVRDGVAGLKEAIYVRELQMIKRGKVTSEVEKYIERLTV